MAENRSAHETRVPVESSREIVMPCELNRWRKRSVSLHKHFARRFAASSASGHLGEKLKSALACAEIRQMQGQIGVDNSDERYVRKVQTFGNHLRADQDVDLAGAK